MDEKMFELMTTIYSELSEFRKETHKRFENFESRFQGLENGQKKLEAILENDIKPDIKALYEGYGQV